MDKLSVTVSDTSTLVESYLQDDYADYLYEAYREKEFDDPEIEYIFERWNTKVAKSISLNMYRIENNGEWTRCLG